MEAEKSSLEQTIEELETKVSELTQKLEKKPEGLVHELNR